MLRVNIPRIALQVQHHKLRIRFGNNKQNLNPPNSGFPRLLPLVQIVNDSLEQICKSEFVSETIEMKQ